MTLETIVLYRLNHPMPQGLRLINKKVVKLLQNDRDEARFKNGEV